MTMQAYIGFTFNAPNMIVPAPFVIPQGIPRRLAPSPWEYRKNPVPEIWVTVVTGDEDKLKQADGTFPSVALWDEKGQRIGQYNTGNTKVSQGSEKTVIVRHTQNDGKEADPGYIMLSQGKDAICIAMVQVSNSQFTAAWYGDTGFTCGQTWYYSRRKFGHENLLSKCVWLDGDHSGGINARAMSFHLKDMLPATDKMRLYEKDNNKYLCGSTPRFSYWKNLEPDGEIPFFNPPLEYNPDSGDRGKEGADKNPDRALDKETYNKEVFRHQGESRKVRRSNRPDISRLSRRQGSNMDPEHLVVTEIAGQTAREVCEHPNSAGFDIASYVDMKYCDLSERKLYDFCGGDITSNCFDANSTTLVGAINARREESGPRKSYKTKSHWK